MNDITLQLGKNGVTPNFLDEARSMLEKHKKVRIRILKSAFSGGDRKRIFTEITGRIASKSAGIRGNVITLEL
ncbi:MAG: YhbY family RNA-binding protein [Candidatus Altiarchaeota archaeon]